MRGKTTKSNRLRKLGLLVCGASIIGTLAGVARSQAGSVPGCFFNLTNSTNQCVFNLTTGGNPVLCCVEGASTCLQACLPTCQVSKSYSNSLCLRNCFNQFLFSLGTCIGSVSNLTKTP
jgi:hypothetical protein